ncbi:MAG: hypothetical protein ACYTXC_02825, partial [Nostoc sp.]
EMVMLPSQLLKDFSLMILTNFLPLWNETALPLRRGEPESKSPFLRGATAVLGSPQVEQVAWI